MSQLEHKVINILRANIDSSFANFDITPESELLKLGLNSVSYIKSIIALEKEFSIKFDIKELNINNLKKVLDIIKLVENKLT